MTFKDKLAEIRKQMSADGVDAYIIASADPHISEYLPERYKCIEFASGFTGSAGTLVITHDFAGLWTDARYFVQAAEQLENSGFELVKLRVQAAPEYIQWLESKLEKGSVVAFDAYLLSVMLAELLKTELETKGIRIEPNKDYLSSIWADRPALPVQPAYLLSEEIAGQDVPTKLRRLREALGKQQADYQLLSSLDDLAWLFNIRGSDVMCNPVVLSFALIGSNDARLFIDGAKLEQKDRTRLEQDGISILPYDEVEAAIASLPGGSSLFIDPKRNCYALYEKVPAGVRIIQGTNPTTIFKAVKEDSEIANMRQTMIKDGVALARFFKWLEEHVGKEKITEVSIAGTLDGFRAQQEGYIGESFDAIAGYKHHGALPHYKATPASDIELQAEGLFLLDSGGQYQRGTTDITRVVSLGKLNDEERTDYTLVLKALIEGSSTIFPKGSRGYQIDAITRKPLWDHACNYGHGTGHGIGYCLNVHEGPQVFNPTNLPVEIEPGMITSIEPGLYKPSRYGIRIENLVLTVPYRETEFGEFYAFETLTLALIDTEPVNKALLEQRHIDWLNEYNQLVFEKLSPYLNEEENLWLKNKTRAI